MMLQPEPQRELLIHRCLDRFDQIDQEILLQRRRKGGVGEDLAH